MNSKFHTKIAELPFAMCELESLLNQMGEDGYRLHMTVKGNIGVFYKEISATPTSEGVPAPTPVSATIPQAAPQSAPADSTPPQAKLSTQQLRQQFKRK